MASYLLLNDMIEQPEVVGETTRVAFVSIPRKLNKGGIIRRSAMVLLIVFAPLLVACDAGPSQDEIGEFIADALPALAEWDPNALQPYATAEAMEVFSQPDQGKIFRVASRLGGLIGFDPPATTNWQWTTNRGYTVTVQNQAKFENGDATVTWGLVYRNDQIKMQKFHINSSLFLDLVDPGPQKKI